MSIKQLMKLRREIPAFNCLPGCHNCCGPVPWSATEMARLHEVCFRPGGISLDCPYLHPLWGCEIYEERPFLCRLFGTVASGRMQCPHGCGPEKPLTEAQAHA